MRNHFITLGPNIPVVPVTSFAKLHLTPDQWAEVWKLCGPSVERNMNGLKPLPLWKVIAAAYLEGLSHGYGLAKDDANVGQDPTAA